MKIILLISFYLLTVYSLSPGIACGHCLGFGEVCDFNECSDKFKCTSTSFSNTKVCLPKIEVRAFCNKTEDYDPCPDSFYCDPRTGFCEVSTKGLGNKNDGCPNGDYCATGLSCKDSKCVSDLKDGECTTYAQCSWNEYCDGKNCKPKPGLGESCSGECQYRATCIKGICVEEHTIEKDASCTSTLMCKPGLVCEKLVCVPPTYRLLGGPGAVWGQECLPGDTGCKCNYGSGIFQYLKESSVTYYPNCPDKKKAFEECMKARGCSRENLAHDSCMRKFCYGPYVAAVDTCNRDPSLVAPRCGANAIAILGMLLLVVLLAL